MWEYDELEILGEKKVFEFSFSFDPFSRPLNFVLIWLILLFSDKMRRTFPEIVTVGIEKNDDSFGLS